MTATNDGFHILQSHHEEKTSIIIGDHPNNQVPINLSPDIQIQRQICIDPNLQPIRVLLSLFPVRVAGQMGIPVSWSLPGRECILVGADSWDIHGVLSSIRFLGGVSGIGALAAGSRIRPWVASLRSGARVAGLAIKKYQCQYQELKRGASAFLLVLIPTWE